MKKPAIFLLTAVAITTAVTVTLINSENTKFETQSSSVDTINSSNEHSEPKPDIAKENRKTAVLALPENMDTEAEFDADTMISDEIATALSGGYDDSENSPLNQVKEAFPELRETIEDYQHHVNQQQQRLTEHRHRLTEYNQQMQSDGYVTDGLEYAIAAEQEQLLAAARELGKRGVELNKAIREQAILRLENTQQ